MQSSAVQRFGVAGLSTTYLTGTLTTAVIRVTSGRPVRDVGHSLLLLGGLIAGAVLGSLLGLHAPVWVPAAQLGLLLLVIVRVAERDDQDQVSVVSLDER